MLDKVIERGRLIHKNQFIFHRGDQFQSVYAIRSGAAKSFCTSDDGTEQVTGLYLAGEIFDWNGLDNNTHSKSAVALETVALCEIPFAQFEQISQNMPILQKHLMRLTTKEITRDQELKSSRAHYFTGKKLYRGASCQPSSYPIEPPKTPASQRHQIPSAHVAGRYWHLSRPYR